MYCLIACQLARRETRCYIFICYLPLRYGATIFDVGAEMNDCPRGGKLNVTCDLKTNLERAGLRRRDCGCGGYSGAGICLENVCVRWLKWCKDRHMWAMLWHGREVRSRTNYIMGSDCLIFRNVTVRYPRHNSNHFMVIVAGLFPL